MDNAGKPLTDGLTAEVDQQAQTFVTEHKVRAGLTFMHGQGVFCRFKFNNDRIFNKQIQSKRFGEGEVIVCYRHGHLSPHRQSPSIELICKTLFINRLQQAGAETAMNLHGRSDNLLANPIQKVRLSLHHRSLPRVKNQITPPIPPPASLRDLRPLRVSSASSATSAPSAPPRDLCPRLRVRLYDFASALPLDSSVMNMSSKLSWVRQVT